MVPDTQPLAWQEDQALVKERQSTALSVQGNTEILKCFYHFPASGLSYATSNYIMKMLRLAGMEKDWETVQKDL